MPFPMTEALKTSVADCFASRIDAGAAPGAYFIVFDETGPILDGGFGRCGDEAGRAPDAGTRFRIASCTKSFVCAALLKLRDAGALSLDAPITDFVPALRPGAPAAAPVAPTLRMLMSMSGGLPTDDPWADRQEAISTADFDAILRRGVWFASVPGSRYEYSNLGFALLGQAIEAASGLGFRDYIAREILTPLGLTQTTFDIAAVPPGCLATGFRRGEQDWIALPQTGPGVFSAIGGIVTTGPDLAKWAGWLAAADDAAADDYATEGDCATEGDAAAGGPLSAASRREMQRIHMPFAPEPDSPYLMAGYGFGLIVEEDAVSPTVSHSGGYPGFSAHMRWNPRERIGVVGFENASYSGAKTPTTQALRLLVEAARGADRGPAPPTARIRALADDLIRLTQAWDDDLAAALCLGNVALDRPWPERRRELDALKAAAGTIDFSGARLAAAGPGDFTLRFPCARGALVCSAQIGPPLPQRLQTLIFRLEA